MQGTDVTMASVSFFRGRERMVLIFIKKLKKFRFYGFVCIFAGFKFRPLV